MFPSSTWVYNVRQDVARQRVKSQLQHLFHTAFQQNQPNTPAVVQMSRVVCVSRIRIHLSFQFLFFFLNSNFCLFISSFWYQMREKKFVRRWNAWLLLQAKRARVTMEVSFHIRLCSWMRQCDTSGKTTSTSWHSWDKRWKKNQILWWRRSSFMSSVFFFKSSSMVDAVLFGGGTQTR